MNILAVLPPDSNIHPLSDLYQNQFIIYVSKSASKNMPLVLNIMKQAGTFETIDVSGKIVYASAFQIKKSTVPLILGIIEMASGWKGFSVFLNQQLLTDYYQVESTLACYSKALQCTDYKAHCNIIYKHPEHNSMSIVIALYSVEEPEKPEPSSWLIPCKKLYRAVNHISKNHPSKVENQLQALAVEQSCNWCPLLNISDFTKIDNDA